MKHIAGAALQNQLKINPRPIGQSGLGVSSIDIFFSHIIQAYVKLKIQANMHTQAHY